MMIWRYALLLTAATPAIAQAPPASEPPEAPLPVVQVPVAPAPFVPPTVWRNPAADYITVGQDEIGYRNWSAASPRHSAGVKGFNDYLTQWGVAGVVPTWQLLRTATSWHRCGGTPFEVPPISQWPHIVQTLRYINDYVIPAVGPVEAVSAYRNPSLNACAGGAPESAHKYYSAVDLVPLQETTREQLMRRLCAAHARRGTAYDVGLGFYAFLRFHVDTTKYRRWGADSSHVGCPPLIRPMVVAAAQTPPANPAQTPAALAPVASQPTPPQTDPLAPQPEAAPAQQPPVEAMPETVTPATTPAPVLQTDRPQR